MSDYTDDDSPRERYEGPMASAAKAETVTCHLCGDTGIVHFKGGDENCAACHARMVLDTGVRATGEVVDGSSGVVPLTVVQGVSPLTVGQGVVPLTVTTPAYIKPALGHGASGLPLDPLSGLRPDERDVTIAEQAAEIKSLGQTVVKLAAVVDDVDKVLAWIVDGKASDKASDVLGEESTDDGLKLFQIVAGYKALASQHETLRQQLAEATLIDAPELRTERDTLRLEVQKLKDLNYEAQDRYAALEAERDELRHRWHAERTRAEKYLRVIEAKDIELFYTVSAHSAALKACVAMAEAGLPLHVIEETE